MEPSLEPDWLYLALRYSVSATSTSSSGPDFDHHDPRFRNLTEAILYSRRLLLTYNAVVVIIIVVFIIGHWFDRARALIAQSAKHQAQNQKVIKIGDGDTIDGQNGGGNVPALEGSSSSGSSTLEGRESPPVLVKTINEDTPLLHDGRTLKPDGPVRSLMGSIKAFLIYQPSPIPFINKSLPSNGCTILIMAFIFLNIFYTTFNIKFDRFVVFVLADRCGLVFIANLPLLYLLAAKTQPIKLLTGYSYESLNIIHRRLGELLCFEALLHFLGMTATWYLMLRPAGLDFGHFIARRIIVLGLFAFLAYELMYFTSLGRFRQRWYELFLALHISLQSTALVLVFFHHSQSRVYVGIALGIFLIDRLVYRLSIKSFTTSGTVQVTEDGETVLVSASIPQQRPTLLRSLFGKSILHGWQASDHVFITVPSLGRTHILQAHPFTIISLAPSPLKKDTRNPAILSLLIRSHATSKKSFSASLLAYALQRRTLNLRLDGPYGSQHAQKLLSSSNLAILIAGGSGISVAWPLLHSLIPPISEIHLDGPPSWQSMPSQRKIVLIWIMHSRLHASWLPPNALEDLRAAAAANSETKTEVHVITPRPTVEAGRPDVRALLRDVVLTSRGGMSRDEKGLDGRLTVGVVASGPDGMARGVRNAVAGLVNEGWDIRVRVEKFGW